MKKFLSVICSLILLSSVSISAYAATFTPEDCVKYGVHIDEDNQAISNIKGTYKVVLKNGKTCGSVMAFSDIDGYTVADWVCVSLEEKDTVYMGSDFSTTGYIYLDSDTTEKIVITNCVLEFVSLNDLTEQEQKNENNISLANDFS